MERRTFNVVFFCKKTKVTKKGKAPVYARITTNRQATKIYTQCQIEPERWNQKAEQSLARDAVSMQINDIVTSFRANILAAYDQMIKEGKSRTALPLKSGLPIPMRVRGCSLPSLESIATNGRKRTERKSANLPRISIIGCCLFHNISLFYRSI